MTDYTTLSNTAVGVGGLPSGATVTALRDNLISVIEGDVSAPKIQGLAAATDRGGLPIVAVTAADTVNTQQGVNGVSGTLTATTTLVVAYTFTIGAFTGSMRFKAAHKSSIANNSNLYLYKNTVLIASFATTSTTSILRSVDSTVAVGDVFEWKHNAAGGVTSTVNTVGVYASDGYIPQSLYILSSET